MSLDPSKRSRSQPKVTATPKKQTAVEANMPKVSMCHSGKQLYIHV